MLSSLVVYGSAMSTVSYLGVADLQSARVQQPEPGVMSGHQNSVFLPQDGGWRCSRRLASQNHCPIERHRVIGGPLTDDGRRPV